MKKREIHHRAAPEFERGERASCGILRKAQRCERLSERLKGNDGGRPLERAGKELQSRGRNNAKRAFRADHQVAQIIAAVVLFQSSKAVPDAAIREHDFEAETKLAGVAIGEHGRAPRVGREHPADHAAAFGREAQGKEASGLFRNGLGFRQRHAGLNDKSATGGIDIAHTAKTGEREENFRSASGWDLPADKSGIARLRDDADAVRVGQRQNGGNFSGRAGAQHHRRLAGVLVAPLFQIWLLINTG